MDFFNVIGSTASIIGMVFALLAWLKSTAVERNLEAEKERQNKKHLMGQYQVLQSKRVHLIQKENYVQIALHLDPP